MLSLEDLTTILGTATVAAAAFMFIDVAEDRTSEIDRLTRELERTQHALELCNAVEATRQEHMQMTTD